MIYTIALGKGGTGKSSIAAELVRQLSDAGRRVVALDVDRQGNFTTRLGVDRNTEVEYVSADVLTGEATIEDAAIPSPSVDGVHVVAATNGLSGLDNRPEIVAGLRASLADTTAWDDIVIDTPPSLGPLTQAAITAADVIVAPVSCDGEAYEQLAQLQQFIQERVNRPMRRDLQIDWVIPTKYDKRRVLDREVIELLHERYGEHVTPPIRETVVVKDSYLAKLPVSLYAPSHVIVDDFRQSLGVVTTNH